MGDHFVLLVDRLLTESTLEAAIQSRNRAMQEEPAASEVDVSLIDMDVEDVKSPRKVVQCRICHDEDENSNMETPCSCCGSLKYAHRRCIQKWCNEKGDTICEICHQQYKPGYTAPPPLFQFGRIPMTFRGNWEISRRDLNQGHLVRMVSTDQNFNTSNYHQHSAATFGSLLLYRPVVLIVMGWLIFKQFIPLIFIGNEGYSISLLLLALIRAAVIAVSAFFIAKAMTSLQRIGRLPLRVSPNAMVNLSDEDENEQVALPSQLHVIHVQ